MVQPTISSQVLEKFDRYVAERISSLECVPFLSITQCKVRNAKISEIRFARTTLARIIKEGEDDNSN